MRKLWLLPIVGGLFVAGCAATVPTGPSVMVLPGRGKDFETFKYDDYVCRDWASQQTGTTTQKAGTESTVTGAAVGTVLGAASGAAIGAAAGDPAMGAAVGSGVGLLGGTAVGAEQGAGAQWSVQQRYDHAYMQCMYAKGHEIPMPAGSRRASEPMRPAGPPPPDVPPPPSGNPPPPPPGTWR